MEPNVEKLALGACTRNDVRMAKKSRSDELSNADSPGSGFTELSEPGRDVGAVLKSFAALGLIALFTVFAVQNADSVDVKFLAWDFSIPLIFLLLASVAIGIAVFELGSFLRKRRA